MPTRVENMPPEQHHHEKLPINDPHHPNNHWVHKEALRVAIGSILVPKRAPLPPGSRSTSGTTSPYSFPTSTSHTPGTGTPIHAGPTPFAVPPGEYLHPHHAFLQGHHHHHQQHPHTPSKLARSTSSSPPGGSPRSSPTLTKSPVEFPPPADPPRLPTQNQASLRATQNENTTPHLGGKPKNEGVALQQPRPIVTPLQPTAGGNGKSNSSPVVPTSPGSPHGTGPPHTSGRGTPRTGFLEKLQSKSAWDALIHGSTFN